MMFCLFPYIVHKPSMWKQYTCYSGNMLFPVELFLTISNGDLSFASLFFIFIGLEAISLPEEKWLLLKQAACQKIWESQTRAQYWPLFAVLYQRLAGHLLSLTGIWLLLKWQMDCGSFRTNTEWCAVWTETETAAMQTPTPDSEWARRGEPEETTAAERERKRETEKEKMDREWEREREAE